ncbi:ABC transporter related protein [Methanofollis liminatans DSM 4140]|uniref:Molybdate/tungstate import ATP-binding protein WtpC n=1 Tax=Methanofollis liminatans DSM 4140 TaxID=28892 RepID=J1ANP3_9EURY|nr:ATP-binding cassette domain-containing protein [Methanofollis liminatans]EJG06493.1 ABC transporter related protein [Methanofollis liminatans DSM 4140]
MLVAVMEKHLRDYTLDLEIAVGDGETLVLIGENGAGKSTVLNLVAGLLHPDAGSITLSGRTLFDDGTRTVLPPEDRRIGYVLQNYALFPHMSVAGNVAFGLLSRGVPKGEAQERAAGMLGRMGIAAHADDPPGALSGGQRQRVALARALVTDPDLLLLDEPLAALDVRTKNVMRKELRACIREAGIPAVIVTHALRDALELGDRIAVIEEGRITASGTPDDILRPGANSFVANFFCSCVHGVREGESQG